MLSKNNSTPRKAVGIFPIGGEGSMFVTLEGAAMYVAEPNHNTRVIRAKTIERGFIPASISACPYLRLVFD